MIYITGATGRLGKEVLALIPKAIPLVRSKSNLKNEIITDFSELQLKKLLKNAKTIIHLAGSMNFLDHHELWDINVKLTERIVNSTPKDAKIIYASSISVYGKEMLENPANEDTKLNPDSPYAKSKDFAEKIVEKHTNNVILRIGTIYGKEFEDYYTILDMIKKQKMFILGEGNNRVSFVHVKDVADAIKNSITKGKGIYILAGPPETQLNILKLASKLLKVPEPTQKTSVSLALMFAKAEELKAHLQKKKPKITREHVLILSSDRIYNCSKAKKDLGFKPRSIKEGLKEMINSKIKQLEK